MTLEQDRKISLLPGREPEGTNKFDSEIENSLRIKASTTSPRTCKQCLELHYNNKQLFDEVFVISRIIEVEVGVISRSRRLRLITHTETSIILDITKTESNNYCFIIL